MSDDEDNSNVTRLGVRYKAPLDNDDNMLRLVRFEGCNHRNAVVNGRIVHASYLLREGETEVECGLCHVRLDPMFVLRHLADAENRWQQSRQAYRADMIRLEKRSQTKCQHCGRMTRISRP